MFNGIVETIGMIKKILLSGDCFELLIAPYHPFYDLHIGDSIAVNGVCLTITNFDAATFAVIVVPETLRLTNLDEISIGQQVNLERAIKVGDRIGGHYVQGHVDFSGEILNLQSDGDQALLVKISNPTLFAKYIINKGHISLDGMSITVIEATSSWFTVTFIPHTQEVTIVQQYQVGTRLNVEVDMMGKYVEKLLGVSNHASTY